MTSLSQTISKPYQSGSATLARFLPVKETTANGSNKVVIACTAATDKVCGVTLTDGLNLFYSIDVAVIGFAKVKAASSITKGDTVALDAADFTAVRTVIPVATGGVSVPTLIGYAQDDAVAGDLVEVRLSLVPVVI